MFWLSNNKHVNEESIFLKYNNLIAGISSNSLNYKFKELESGYFLSCSYDFKDQYYEDEKCICFFSGYISGKSVDHSAKSFLKLISFSGSVVRAKGRIGGIFNAFIYKKDIGKIIFFSSQGTPNYCYKSIEKYISISDKPLLSAIGQGDLTINEKFIEENIACGFSLSNTTLFAGVNRVEHDSALVINLRKNKACQIPFFAYDVNQIGEKNIGLDEAVNLFSESLVSALSPLPQIVSQNGGKIEIRVSGGKDSRTILAALDSIGVKYSPIIYGLGYDDESKVANELLKHTKHNDNLVVDTPLFPSSYEEITKNIDLMLLRMNGFIHTEARQSAYLHPVLSETRNPIILGHAHLQRGGFARTMVNDREKVVQNIKTYFTSSFVDESINNQNSQVVMDYIDTCGHDTYNELLYWVNRKYRVTNYLEAHYHYQSAIGIPYYPLIDHDMIQFLDNIPQHHKVSEKMVFSSIDSFNSKFSLIPLAGKRWRFEAVENAGFYEAGYEMRSPSRATNLSQAKIKNGYKKNKINELYVGDDILNCIYEYIKKSHAYSKIERSLSVKGKKILDKEFVNNLEGLDRKVHFDFLWRIYLLCKAVDLNWLDSLLEFDISE